MRNRWMVSSTAVACALLLAAATAPGQTGYKAPRAPDGKPNVNGIWQANNTAHWDIEAHSAAAGAVVALGAAYSIPCGFGVVDCEMPYKPEALAGMREKAAKLLEL